MPESVLDFTATSISGEEVPLSKYRGSLVMIVNVASKCGFTPQYEGLQKLFEAYGPRGFVILGFPSNDFLWQEPGTDNEIASFCRITYGVSFPMFSKISVRGKGQHPLWAFLTSKKTNPKFGGRITWNFNKFLVGRDGAVIGRFPTRTEPMSRKVVEAVEKAIETPPPDSGETTR